MDRYVPADRKRLLEIVSTPQSNNSTSPPSVDAERLQKVEPVAITNVEADSILTGKTLEVYKYIMIKHKAVGPRQVQRALKLSSSGVATFHLEKLQRAGLITKNEVDGSFSISRIYLKHFFLLRSYLVPRYFLYAGLFTVLSAGWIASLYLGIGPVNVLKPTSASGVFYVFVYGLISTLLAAGVFWYESLRVLKREVI
jgi:predicted DNA-binding transcriptional regulator